jgi:hypothetical protein
MSYSQGRRSSKRPLPSDEFLYGPSESTARSNLFAGYAGFGVSSNPYAYNEPVAAPQKDLPIPRLCTSGVILMSDGQGGVKGTELGNSEKDGRRIESALISLSLAEGKSKTFCINVPNVEISNISAIVEWPRETSRPRIPLPFTSAALRSLICQYMDGEYIEFRVVVQRTNRDPRHTGQLDSDAKLTATGRLDHESSIVTLKSLYDANEPIVSLRCGENATFISGIPLCIDKSAKFNASVGDTINISFESNGLSPQMYPTFITVTIPFNPL